MRQVDAVRGLADEANEPEAAKQREHTWQLRIGLYHEPCKKDPDSQVEGEVAQDALAVEVPSHGLEQQAGQPERAKAPPGHEASAAARRDISRMNRPRRSVRSPRPKGGDPVSTAGCG